MQIIFLNAWRGNIPELKDFIQKNIPKTDIFSFQESNNSKGEIFCLDYLKKEYQSFCDFQYLTTKSNFHNTTFIKKNLKVLESKTIGKKDKKIGLGIFTKLKDQKGKTLNLINFHGFAYPGSKKDTPDRLKQSQEIVDFLKNYSGPKVVGGDFNLDRDIKSTQIFEKNGFRSLIKEFDIKNTRNKISWDKYEDKQHFADHVFVSKDVKVKSFTVPYNEVSDHLPMFLEIEL